MKKILLGLVLSASVAFAASAQEPAPKCQNQNALEGQINGIEAQGWVEASRTFYPIYYVVQPENPSLIGSLQVVFAPECNALEPCPKITRILYVDAYRINKDVCIWDFSKN
ncbi:MAG: hypothetical protein EP338_01895 [Bacteroidetes bacterium]|nr:MAG: hypothetical protein EP338_01895 [Bacteroidota bacterium]